MLHCTTAPLRVSETFLLLFCQQIEIQRETAKRLNALTHVLQHQLTSLGLIHSFIHFYEPTSLLFKVFVFAFAFADVAGADADTAAPSSRPPS